MKNMQILSLESSLLVGIVYDLSQPLHLNEEISCNLVQLSSDTSYVLEVHIQVDALVKRFESLNNIYTLLSFDEFPLITPRGAISREDWIRTTIDALLSRLTSIRDCVYLLVSELYELRLPPKSVSKFSLKKSEIIKSFPILLDFIDNIAKIGEDFRNERDLHFHRGQERNLGNKSPLYYIASFYESLGKETKCYDASGNMLSIKHEHKIIVEQIENEFKETAEEYSDAIHKLLDYIYPFFKKRFIEKMVDSGNKSKTATHLIERAEKYSKEINENNNI